jgi:S-formylglutathione hydrolase FrmB
MTGGIFGFSGPRVKQVRGIPVKKTHCIGVLLISALAWSPAAAGEWLKDPCNELILINKHLRGRIVDHTCNHGTDNRIWSRALYQKRDLYVYLPPCFDPCQRYPLVLWLHGFGADEKSFVQYVAPLIDEAIVEGKLPEVIVAAPDGSINGEPSLFNAGSFFLNSNAGDFEDFLLQDVWDFLVTHYPIRPERQAHVIAGASMGGFAAYNLAFKHRECFGVVIGVFPPLNLRWVNCRGRYFANFDPKNWGWRTKVSQGHEVIARFYGGLVTVRLKQVIDPLFGRDQEGLVQVAKENPIEMVDRLGIHEGDLCMYVAYGGKDEFNVDAQVESFLYLARCRGLTVGVGYEPKGRHNLETARKLFPGVINWLAPLIGPYSPPVVVAGPCEPSPDSSVPAGPGCPTCPKLDK